MFGDSSSAYFTIYGLIAFLILLAISAWLYYRWPEGKFLLSSYTSPNEPKKKKKEKDILIPGPFPPAMPLTTIPPNVFFIDSLNQSYRPGENWELHPYEIEDDGNGPQETFLMFRFYLVWQRCWRALCSEHFGE